MTAARSYSSYTRDSRYTTRPARAVVGGDLSPLHEVAAPGIERLPSDVRRAVAREFYRRHERAASWADKYDAQGWAAAEVAGLHRARVHVAFDEREIDDRARRAAAICQKFLTLDGAAEYARSVGVVPPEPGKPKGVTRLGALKRLQCVRWWRRAMRRQWTRQAESHLRSLGFVQRRRQLYASDRAVAWRRERKLRDRTLLQELQAVSDDGDQLELWAVVEKSNANPAIRRAELMTRMRGFEEVAKAAGHVAEFYTLTAPSALHAINADGSKNPHYLGGSPRDAQAWLCRQWAKVRAKLKRLSVLVYGFRIAEPHHDGTPHWHMVLFMPAAAAELVRFVMRAAWLSEFASEPGAGRYRCKVQRIDPAKGSATGYVSKYVAKNIDGFQVGADYEAENADAKETADRVAAWASAHGIRQFQQLGGPQVSVWRELRRLPADACQVGALSDAREAANAGQWAAFVGAVGGIEQGRRGHVQLWSAITGELNQFDELRGPQIAGVRSGGAKARTRVKVWRIERKAGTGGNAGRIAEASRATLSGSLPSLGPVSITVRRENSGPTRGGTGAHRSHAPPGAAWMH